MTQTNDLPFDDDDADRLRELLESEGGDEVMDLGDLDGWLAAITIDPEGPSDEDALPFIFSADSDPSRVPKNDELLGLIARRRRELRRALAAGRGLNPIIQPLVDDEGRVDLKEKTAEALEPWCTGFASVAMKWTADPRPEVRKPLGAILQFAALEDKERAALSGYPFPAEPPRDLEAAIFSLIENVLLLKKAINPNVPLRRSTAAKIGRNDPCPCGSGKKYKNCCGRKAGQA